MDSKLESLGLISNDVEADLASCSDPIYITATEVIGTTKSARIALKKIMLTFQHCWNRNTIFAEPFSMTIHPPPERLHTATSGKWYRGKDSGILTQHEG